MQDHDNYIIAKASNGMQSKEGIKVPLMSYFIITGRTDFSAQNAPFLNLIIPAPLEVQPSGKTKS